MKRLVALCLLLPALVSAQGTDIFLFDLKSDFQLLKQVTDRVGYDSQPAFTHDSQALLFSSDREAEQVDLFRYQISSGEFTNLTNTPKQNEFSAQPLHGSRRGDGASPATMATGRKRPRTSGGSRG